MASRIQAVLLVCLLGNVGGIAFSLLPKVLQEKKSQLGEQSALKIRDEILSGASISKELCDEAGLLCGDVIYPPLEEATKELSVYNPLRRKLLETEDEKHLFFKLNHLSEKVVQVPPLTYSKDLQFNKFLHPILRDSFEAMSAAQLLRATGFERGSVYEKRIVEHVGVCSEHLRGEVKECFSDLDSLLEFAFSHVNGSSERLEFAVPSREQTSTEWFRVVKSELISKSFISCHTIWFPYALYMCHQLQNTHLYQVSLRDGHGAAMIVPVVCHMDTSEFDPTHIALRILESKPGESEVCHWMMNSHIAVHKTNAF